METLKASAFNNIQINSNNTIKSSLKTKEKVKEQKKEAKNNKTIKASLVLRCLATAGIVAIAINSLKKQNSSLPPRTPKIPDTTTQDATPITQIDKIETIEHEFESQVKKFIDSNTKELVQNVKLKKGKAILENEEGFSGILRTKTKSGNIDIEYKNGNMIKSTIDGSIKKEYDILEEETGNKTIRIIKSYHNNQLEKLCEHERINGEKPLTRKVSYFKNGIMTDKIIINTDKDGLYFQKGIVFDETGRVLRELYGNKNNQCAIRNILEGDSVKTIQGEFAPFRGNTKAEDIKIKGLPNTISNYIDSSSNTLENIIKIENSKTSLTISNKIYDGLNLSDDEKLTTTISVNKQGNGFSKDGITFKTFDPNINWGEEIECIFNTEKDGEIIASHLTKEEEIKLTDAINRLIHDCKKEKLELPYDIIEELVQKITPAK